MSKIKVACFFFLGHGVDWSQSKVFLVLLCIIATSQRAQKYHPVRALPRAHNTFFGDRSFVAARVAHRDKMTLMKNYYAVVIPSRLETIGDRAFPAAAASVWNSLPETVRSSPSLPVFCSRLKTELFLGLTAALTNKRLTALTTTWPHYYCYVSLQS